MTLELVRAWDIADNRDLATLEHLRREYERTTKSGQEQDFRDWLGWKIGEVHAVYLPGSWPSEAVQGKHTVCGELRPWSLLSARVTTQPTCDLCVMILRGDLGRAVDLIVARRGSLPEISYARCETHGLQGCSQCAPVEPGPVAPTLASVPPQPLTKGMMLGAVAPTSPTIERQKLTCRACWAETYFPVGIEGAAEKAIGDHWRSSPSCREFAERLDGRAAFQ